MDHSYIHPSLQVTVSDACSEQTMTSALAIVVGLAQTQSNPNAAQV